MIFSITTLDITTVGFNENTYKSMLKKTKNGATTLSIMTLIITKLFLN
jgi:hypothetical protein